MEWLWIKNYSQVAVKDKGKRTKDKVDSAKLEVEFETKYTELKEILIDKLFKWSMEKLVKGFTNDLGEEVMPKGKKFTQKMLQNSRRFRALYQRSMGYR
jgi:DNA-directed RNA polymerase subunit beta